MDSASNASLPARLRLGSISGAHGLHGALRLRLDNPDSDTLVHVGRVFIERDDQLVGEYRVRGIQKLNRAMMRLLLEGLDNPEIAESLRGATVAVAVADLPAKGSGEFYYFEAIGCTVVSTEGRRLGVIEEVFATGANDVWVVRDGSAEVLVPVIEDIVKSIDLEARLMVIEPVPGLLD